MNSSSAPAQDEVDQFLASRVPGGKMLAGIKSLTDEEIQGDIGQMTCTFIKEAGYPHLANRDSLIEMRRRLN